jgi:hypothetical protein
MLYGPLTWVTLHYVCLNPNPDLEPCSQWLPTPLPRIRIFSSCICLYHGASALVSQDLLIIEDSLSHSDTPHSVALL